MRLPPLVKPVEDLSNHEISRYSRHLLIPEVGLEGQKRLKSSRVLVIGAGGLGSPVSGISRQRVSAHSVSSTLTS